LDWKRLPGQAPPGRATRPEPFCDGCGRDYFLPFSYRQRGACPSCSTKRSILFGEKVRELVKPICHVHDYYGVYSSSYRGKQRRENEDDPETELVLVTIGKGTAGGKPTSTWARLIRRIFEVDPLRCRRCGAEMRLIAFITDFRQTSRILEHIGEQTIRPPPLTAKTSPAGLSWPEAVDYIPDVDAYVQDPIYPD